jgi:hypothetical protein
MVSGNGKSPAARETEAKKSPSFNGEIIIPGSPWGSQAQPAPVSMPGSGWGVAIHDRGRVLQFSLLRLLYKLSARGHEPLSVLQGEREGPHGSARSAARGQAPGWEGEVGGATSRLVGPPPPGTARRAGRPGATLSPRPAVGEGKGRVVRATLRRQIFEKPVVTLSPDSPAGCGEGWGETLRKRRPLTASETKKSKTLEDNYYPPSFSWQGKPKSVEPQLGDVAGVLF